jgi:DNA repair photolyase
MTVTGWEEVEFKAPTLQEGAKLLQEVAKAYGPQNVTWRFSPIPDVPDVLDRFEEIMGAAAQVGLKKVFLSFLQTNDRMVERRGEQEKLAILARMSERAVPYGMKVELCNEDRLLTNHPGWSNLTSGVCAPPEMYALPGLNKPPSEGCGCVLMADPFTITEKCGFSCRYCYAADESVHPRKRDTTRKLPVLP